jgi:GNAT superfamily N-acetyltransferase
MRIDLVEGHEARPLRGDLADIFLPAFRDDPLVRGLYPSDLDYVCHFPGLVAAVAANAFGAATVQFDASGHGAALWFPPGARPDIAAIRERLRASLPARRFAFAADGLEILARLRPEKPHWYLPWLGVVPEAQGAGLGGTLLAAGLARADRAGIPVYAEATSRRSLAFYTRHGFETWARMALPGCPEVVAMWRPAPARTAPRRLYAV